MNPRTLLPEVVEPEVCSEALERSTDPADEVFVLLAQGRVGEAAEAAAEARLKDPSSFSLQVLDADILRANGDTERALARLKVLRADVANTANESWVHQALGKVYFSAGNYAAAANSFALALDQRVAAGADAAAIYSSTVALRRARDLQDSAE
ncbi:tetratricopeptide repeat protein [Pseudarthrobacter sp. P1]|uniref:tetratricopeptide repeat protein n=1 Tax=Pseudarthrobacter sp. P1 TaxID=3418418 RepID=UPI003CF7A25F